MKILLILLFLSGISHGQTPKVKLKPGSLYYNSMDSDSGTGIKTQNNDVFVLRQPLQKIGMFKASLKNKIVYIGIGDIVSTPQYKAYFNKYFFSPFLKEWNTNGARP